MHNKGQRVPIQLLNQVRKLLFLFCRIGQITNEAKDAIQDYFKGEINKYIDTSASDYSFPKANNVLNQIASYYPDSSFLLEQTEVVKVSQKRKLGEKA